MPSYYAIQVNIGKDSGIPEDAVTNTFHFRTEGTDLELTLQAIGSRLDSFYGEFDAYLSAELASTYTAKYYDLSEPQPRVPLYEYLGTLTPGATATVYPSEVALCLSYQGLPISGMNQARRRGRLYLGPWNTGAGAGQPARPIGGVLTAISTAAAALAVPDLTATMAHQWCVFSPTTLAQTGDLEEAFIPVDNGWIDNAFDTQRRRGVASTSRTTWT